MTDGAKPNEKVRVGNVQVAEWRQEVQKDGRTFETFNYTIQRSYTDKEGNWQNTNSFGKNDLWKLQVALNHFLHKDAQVEE